VHRVRRAGEEARGGREGGGASGDADEADDRPRPPNWRLSPWAVVTYLLGGTLPDGTAIAPKYVGQRRLVEIAVATLTATVVVPTPPLAPTNANTSAFTAGAGRCAISRAMAASSSAADTGSVTNSFTPERMASSSSDGSSRDATMTTPVVGCWRFRSGSAAGRCD